MKHLETLLTSEGWGHFDETTMRMFGKQGYLWLLTVACAAMVVALRPSRGKKIFDEELAFARHLVGVVDGYKVYEIVLGEIRGAGGTSSTTSRRPPSAATTRR